MMNDFMQWLRDWLDRKLFPGKLEDVIFRLVYSCMNMGLPRDHYVLFNGVPGTCGDIRLGGTVAPVFSYLVFYKPKMEFVRVSVKLCKPDKIEFVAYIEGHDITTDGKELEVVPQFRAPFFKLASHICRYFPYGVNPPAIQINEWKGVSNGTV